MSNFSIFEVLNYFFFMFVSNSVRIFEAAILLQYHVSITLLFCSYVLTSIYIVTIFNLYQFYSGESLKL